MTYEKRSKIIALWGSSAPNLDAAGHELSLILTRVFGGASLTRVTGYWAHDGNNTHGPYDLENTVPEPTLRIELLVLTSEKDRAIQILGTACRDLNRSHDLGCEYLHIECAESTSSHTDIR